ncbi:MAG TPA: hypothetical protein VHX86_17560 [Tepidisphaeraceae bacterium]|jgi:hypothetical protein|nr:hypothetical protein [Tepidisphaeraceae bacterium]
MEYALQPHGNGLDPLNQFEPSGQNQRLLAEAEYAAETWDRQRRTIITAIAARSTPAKTISNC